MCFYVLISLLIAVLVLSSLFCLFHKRTGVSRQCIKAIFLAKLLHRSVKNKEKNAVYIRTKDSVMTELKSHLQHDTTKTVERRTV